MSGQNLTPNEIAILTEGICPQCRRVVEWQGGWAWSCGDHWFELVATGNGGNGGNGAGEPSRR